MHQYPGMEHLAFRAVAIVAMLLSAAAVGALVALMYVRHDPVVAQSDSVTYPTLQESP